MIIKELIRITFQSINRTSGSSSKFFIDIPNFQELKQDMRYCSLISATVPKSTYVIPEPGQIIEIVENLIPRNITVPPGVYSFNGFDRLDLVLLPLLNVGTYQYAINANTRTGKYEITVSSNVDQPIWFFPAASLELRTTLGFTNSQIQQFVSNNLVSVSPVNFQPYLSLAIASDICESENIIGTLDGLTSNVSFSVVSYINPAPFASFIKIKPMTTQKIYINLIDSAYLRDVSLNGLDWEFTLAFFSIDESMKTLVLDKKQKRINELKELTDEYFNNL